jgi:hypothetical protein
MPKTANSSNIEPFTFSKEDFYTRDARYDDSVPTGTILHCRRVALKSAAALQICSLNGKLVFEVNPTPGSKPWFLLHCDTVFFSGGGKYSSPRSIKIKLITDGRGFLPVRLVGNSGRGPSGAVAKVMNNYSPKVDWGQFGPADKALVKWAIAKYLGR